MTEDVLMSAIIDEHKAGTVNPLTKIILFLHLNSTDTQVRPARANQHLRNTHKTAPKIKQEFLRDQIETLWVLQGWQLHNT